MNKETNQELLRIINEEDPYSILGVTENTDMEEITKIFKSYAKQYHPDKNSNLKGTKEYQDSESIFKKISNAYRILKDPDERKKYDFEVRFKRVKEAHQENTTDPGNERKTGGQSFRLNNNMKSFTLSQFKVAELDQEKLEEMRAEREKKDTENTKNSFENAKKLLKKDSYDEAITLLKKLLERHPHEAAYHSHLGLAMQKKGWESYAQGEFRVALHYNPKDEIALQNYKVVSENKEKTENKGFFSRLFKKN